MSEIAKYLPFEVFSPERIDMWEIYVPKYNAQGSVNNHTKWDQYVCNLAGGLTVLGSQVGKYQSADENTVAAAHADGFKQIIRERMIPVRIACTESNIKKIADFTCEFYFQEAVLYYKVVENVVIHKHNG